MLYNIIFNINTAISSKKYFELFGISLLKMDNGLMEGDISKNALIITKEVDEENLTNGDIIAYEVHGQIKINKIYNSTDEGYKTKYNQAYYIDIETIKYNQIIGKVFINIPVLGSIIEILQSKIVSGIVIIILVLLYSYDRYKSDKNLERKRKKLIVKKKRGRKNVFCKTRRI